MTARARSKRRRPPKRPRAGRNPTRVAVLAKERGLSERKLYYVNAIGQEAPDLAQPLEDGEISVRTARELLSRSVDERAHILRESRDRKPPADHRDTRVPVHPGGKSTLDRVLEYLRSCDGSAVPGKDYWEPGGRNPHGATDEQIAKALQLTHQTANAARRRLVAAGLVVKDDYRHTDSRRWGKVWVLKELLPEGRRHDYDDDPAGLQDDARWFEEQRRQQRRRRAARKRRRTSRT